MKELKIQKISISKNTALYGIVLFIIFFSFTTNNYFTLSNLGNVLRQSAVLSIISLCSFLAILTHQTDLSIGGVAGLTGMVAAFLLEKGVSVFIACLCAICVGGLFGMFNGIIAGLTTIPTFIITLATMNIAESLGMVLRTGTIQIRNETFQWFSNGSVWFIPFSLIFVLTLYLLFNYILHHRRYGTYLYAVGGKEEAALTAGINVRLIKISVFVINGFLAGMAGIMLASRLSSANPSSGMGLELDGICSAVLGGTALTGGKGSAFGTLLGAIAMSLLHNGMNMMGLRLVTQKLVIGIVLLVILTMDILQKKGKK